MQSNERAAQRPSRIMLFIVTAIFPAIAVFSQPVGLRDNAAFDAVLAYFFGFAFGQMLYKQSASGTNRRGE